MSLKSKTVKESETTMTELIMPNDTNPLGNLMGGNLLRWMDIAGGICASKHCSNHCVTAAVDHVTFQSPISVGDVITIKAQVTRTFNTSVEVYLEVFADNVLSDRPKKSNHAYMTFVALDRDTLRPTAVPELVPLTEQEQKLFESASRRREIRLILSGRIKPQEASEIKEFFSSVHESHK